jgi:hypothetical protein
MGSTAGMGIRHRAGAVCLRGGDVGGDDLADLAQDHVEVVPVGGNRLRPRFARAEIRVCADKGVR